MSDRDKLYPFTTVHDPQISQIRWISNEVSKNNISITLGASLLRTFILYKSIPSNQISTNISERLAHYLEMLTPENQSLKNFLNLIKFFQGIPSASDALKNLVKAVFNDYYNIIESFITLVLEDEFSGAREILANEFNYKTAGKLFETFANAFLVSIHLYDNSEINLTWSPSKIGTYPVIPIAFKNNSLYWVFSNYLLAIERGEENLQENVILNHPFVMHVNIKYIENDKLFLQENIQDMPSLELTEKGIISKRTHISKLPLTIETILELQLEYCHCHAVQKKDNQITAFGIALYFALKRPSLKEFQKKLFKKFLNQQTFTHLTLPQSKDFRDQKFVRFLLLIKEIMMHAWENSSKIAGFTDFPDGTLGDLESELGVDDAVIKMLSIIFGVTAVVIRQDHMVHGKFERCIYNMSGDLSPSLHFLATRTNGLLQFFVLITNKHQYEISYNLLTEKTIYNRQLNIVDIPTETIENPGNSSIQDNSIVDFLHDVCRTEARVLNSIKDKLIKNQPIKIDEEFVGNEVNKLKNLKLQLKAQARFEDVLSAIENPQAFRQKCHFCGKTDNLISLNSQGCLFHKNCIDSIFSEWINQQVSFATKIKTQEFLCAPCSAPIKLSYYLENVADMYIVEYCKEKFNKNFICKICKRKNHINLLFVHSQTCTLRICIPCVVNFSLNKMQNACSNCNFQLLVDLQTAFNCEFCRHTTALSNFVKVPNEKNQIACKKCWFQIVQDLLYFSDDANILNQGNEELKKEKSVCQGCSIEQYRNYSNYYCMNGCWLCSKCIFEKPDMSCKNCGGQIIIEMIYQKGY